MAPTANHSRPASGPSSGPVSTSSSQTRVNKPKGTRSVSSLTPAQLARKRANDREAQRAIRARTKDHIERLETELNELRNRNNRDHAVQELMRRNRALEDELTRLQESIGISATSSPCVKNLYDDNMSTGSSAIPSPRASPYSAGGDYVAAAAAANSQFVDYSQAGYVHFPPACETWTATIPAPAPAAAIASNVASLSPALASSPDGLIVVNGVTGPTSAPMVNSGANNDGGTLPMHENIFDKPPFYYPV